MMNALWNATGKFLDEVYAEILILIHFDRLDGVKGWLMNRFQNS